MVDGRRLVPRETRGWLRQWDVDIEKRRRIQHSAAAGGRRVSLEERMRSRRRAPDEAWTKKAGRTNSWHRVLVGTSKGSPVRGAAWRVSGFWSTARAGRWLHTTKSLGEARAKPDMVRGGRSFSRGAGADHRCIEPRATYSGRRIDWAREEPELKRGLDLFFFLLAVKVWMPGQTECHLVPVRSQFANSPPSTASPSSAMFFFFFFEHDSGRVDAKRDNLVKPVETRRAAPGSHAPTHPRKRPSHIHARAQPNAELIVGAWVPGCLGAWVVSSLLLAIVVAATGEAQNPPRRKRQFTRNLIFRSADATTTGDGLHG